MTNLPILALAAMSLPQGLPKPRIAPSPEPVAADPDAWGACQVRLVADRVASLRTGSTHKVYRGWRFAVTMRGGQPRPGTTLFSVSLDPAALAASRSRYALVRLAHEGAHEAGGPMAFSWSTSSIVAADPFAAALAAAHRRLAVAGWTPDVVDPTRYTKPDPAMPSSDTVSHRAASEDAPAPRTAGSDHLAMAPPQPQISGLDEWETDGGTCNPEIERSTPRQSDEHR
jgi:hypothetical protein